MEMANPTEIKEGATPDRGSASYVEIGGALSFVDSLVVSSIDR